MTLKDALILRRPRSGRLKGRITAIGCRQQTDGLQGGGALLGWSSGQVWAAICRAAPRLLWTAASLGLFAGIWEACWALGWADPKLLPPPHIFLG
ncbi:MAG TPA: hypothetical protein VN900_10860, partial [Stellaceae bacterium]|nr:hypothetical protein [Stellaceae bacterium]